MALAPHLFVEECTLASIASVRGRYRSTGLDQRLARYHRDADAVFFAWNDIWLSPEFRSWNIEPLIDRLDVPVLAMQGLNDEYGTPAQLETLAARHPKTECMLLPVASTGRRNTRPKSFFRCFES